MNARKISLANVQGRMSRSQMKSIIAGDGQAANAAPCPSWPCGAGGNGTCRTGFDSGKGRIVCQCSDNRVECE